MARKKKEDILEVVENFIMMVRNLGFSSDNEDAFCFCVSAEMAYDRWSMCDN